MGIGTSPTGTRCRKIRNDGQRGGGSNQYTCLRKRLFHHAAVRVELRVRLLALPLAADEWDHLSTIEGPDTHGIGHQSEDSIVVGLSRVFPKLAIRKVGLKAISILPRIEP